MTHRNHSGFTSMSLDVVHSWAMFGLLRRSVRAPTGEIFERSYVSTPGAVCVVAITKDNDLVLVSQYRASCDGLVVEIPAGMRDVKGEDPFATARRELIEETGYVSSSVEYLGSCLSSPGITDSQVEMYIARDVVAGTAFPEGPEEREMSVLLVPFVDAVSMVEKGEITDAKSVCGILLAARRYGDLGL